MFIILLFLCAILASLIAYPLCMLATNFQGAYSISISIIILVSLAFMVLRQVKKHGAKEAIFFLTKFLIIAAGLASFFFMVISGKRLIAIIALVLAGALFLLASKILKSKNTELKTEK